MQTGKHKIKTQKVLCHSFQKIHVLYGSYLVKQHSFNNMATKREKRQQQKTKIEPQKDLNKHSKFS